MKMMNKVHFLTTLFVRVKKTSEEVVFTRSGRYKPKHIALTGIITLACNTLVIPWIFIFISLQPNIRGPLGLLVPLRDPQWWFLVVVVFIASLVCLTMILDFIKVLHLPLYKEEFFITNKFIKLREKKLFCMTRKVMFVNEIENIVVLTELSPDHKYGFIFPHYKYNEINVESNNNQNGNQSAQDEKEYCIVVMCSKIRYIVVKTLFKSEVNELVDSISAILPDKPIVYDSSFSNNSDP
jgi:hypothetical protein